jgi:D-glycero-D-manno-heptose 1,7-bisphosphate phosphatase
MRAPTIRQAAILTGGLGSRLGELTASTPKPLLPCGDRPFLAWLLRELSRFGIEEILLLTGHLGEAVEAALPAIAATLPKPLRITCNREERPAGTGGALFHARKHLAERFLLCNGDSLLDFNLARLLADAAHDPEETVGRIVLRRVDDASRYGVVETGGDQVTAFRERAEAEQPGTINAGLYLFDRRVLDAVSPACSLERDVMPTLASRGVLRGTVADGYFVDIGVPADLARAQTELPARLLRRALFLNREGIINLDRGGRFTFVPGAVNAIRMASDAGWHVFVVGNQSGMARDPGDEAQFASLCARMTGEIRAGGGTIDDWRCCPLDPETAGEAYRRLSSSRKPEAGTLLDLLARWQLDPTRCLLIGDRDSDLAVAAAGDIPAQLFPGHGDLAEFTAPLLRLRGPPTPQNDARTPASR